VWVSVPDGLAATRISKIGNADRIDTYDLMVDIDHEFIAGGILVHNSHHEWVIATNPRYRQNNIGYWMQAGADLGIPGFALGGVWDAAKGAASSVGSSVAGAVGNVAGKGAGFFIDKLPKPDLPAWMKGLGTYAIKHVSEFIKGGFDEKKFGRIVSSVVGKGVLTAGQFLKIAREALQITGHGDVKGGAQTLLWLAQKESSLNPNAINEEDVNAQNGIPSQGLMQVIPPTFSAYHEPGTSSNIKDPLANIAASINYQFDSYGGLVHFTPYAKGGKFGGRGATGTAATVQRLMGPPPGTASRAVAWAKNNLGTQEGSAKELKWAEETGGAVDPWCATFVSAAMKAQGLPLPSNPSYSGAFLNWAGGDTVGSSLSDAIPGDILVFNPDGVGITDHVGIYIGGGQFISGNWSNEVGQAAVSDEGGLVGVVRPHYPGGEGDPAKGGKAGTGGKHPAPSFPAGHTGKGGGTYGQKGPKKGKKPHYTETVLPGLAASALSADATALPSQIQAMLAAPGLTFGQQLSIGELAGTLAGNTQQRTYDAAGNETSADSHADDIAAARFQKQLEQAEQKKAETQLKEVAKELKKAQTDKEQRRLKAKQAALQAKLGKTLTTIQSLDATIGTGPDDPENVVERPTATDFANRDLALAELTEGTADDKSALEALKAIAQQQLDVALTTADPRDDIEAANNLKSVTEALKSLDDTLQRVEQEKKQYEEERLAVDKRLADLAENQGPALMSAVLAWIDGGIGGPIAGRSRLATAGSSAGYQ